MRVLFVGDIVGKSGRDALKKHLPFLKEQYQYDLLIVNGENSAHGKGITENIYNYFISLGVDCITLGNHAFSKDNVFNFIDKYDNIIRPYNMEPEDVGAACYRCTKEGYTIGVYNIYGSAYMDNVTTSPYQAMDELLEKYPSDIKIVDFHGEATGEKYTFMNVYRKEVQMIVGTHTHVQTSDEAIYDDCAFICDVGMTGPYDSILGRDSQEVIDRHVYGEVTRYRVSENEGM